MQHTKIFFFPHIDLVDKFNQRYIWVLSTFIMALFLVGCGGGKSSAVTEFSPAPGEEQEVLYTLEVYPFSDHVNLSWDIGNGTHPEAVNIWWYGYRNATYLENQGTRNVSIKALVFEPPSRYSYNLTGLNASLSYKFVIEHIFQNNLSARPYLIGTQVPRSLGPNVDGDQFVDFDDNCPLLPNSDQKNYDNDSNGDACDTDDDNDSILDTADNCSAGDIGWSSNFITDHDGDGCRDAGEDTDDDNDSILDTADSCSAGDIGWVSNSTTDNDGDGCRDAGEDTDDDNDSIDDSADNCRLVANINQTDLDKDDYGDACDIDDDNNGLIDIDTAEKFNQIRYNLAGTSLTTEMGGIGDITGCDDSSRTDGTGCNGYELTANISLVGYEPWQPIGTCVSDNICPISFDSVFDGNNHSISDLRINTTSLAYGVGLFGAVSPNTSLSNIILDNIRITSSARGSDFGALVGFASGAKIHNVLVEDISISAPEVDSIGSLVGNGENAEISLSSIVANTISGNSRTGGLMGDGLSAKISSSSVVADTINGFWHVGGLIGLGEDAKILSSSVTVTGTISNTGDNVGGLVGYGRNANISLSSVVAGTISSVNNKIGGLVGHGEDVVISLSSVVADTIRGIATFILTRGGRVGGVIGEGQGAQISRTSVVAKTITGRSRVGGIAGYGDNARISASSVVSDSISSVSWWTGGFVGIGQDVEIYSSSVAMRSISGSSYKGGLMGEGSNASIDSSLVMGKTITATVSHAGGIVGASGIIDNANKDPQSVTNTYWLNNISFTNARPASTNTFGESKTETDLQSPTAFTGIYADWDNAWCDPDTAAYITDSSSPLAVAENLIWDLGTNNQYPVIRCVPLTPAQQRTITDRVLAGESPLPLSSP